MLLFWPYGWVPCNENEIVGTQKRKHKNICNHKTKTSWKWKRKKQSQTKKYCTKLINTKSRSEANLELFMGSTKNYTLNRMEFIPIGKRWNRINAHFFLSVGLVFHIFLLHIFYCRTISTNPIPVLWYVHKTTVLNCHQTTAKRLAFDITFFLVSFEFQCQETLEEQITRKETTKKC